MIEDVVRWLVGLLRWPFVAATVARATPADPDTAPDGYTLDWEDPADGTCLGVDPADPHHVLAPAGWAPEYDPLQQHDGHPQVRWSQGGEPVRSGNHSVRFQLYRGDAEINSGVRSELASAPEPTPTSGSPTERWYGFSVCLADGWVGADPDPDPEPGGDHITQWHQTAPAPEGSPPLGIGTYQTKAPHQELRWLIALRTDPVDNAPTENFDAGLCPSSAGEWTDWVVHVIWAGDERGRLDIWKNGQPLLDAFEIDDPQKAPVSFCPKPGPTTFTNGMVTQHYMKFGIYRWGWRSFTTVKLRGAKAAEAHQLNPLGDSVHRRVLYHDEVRIRGANGSKQAVTPRGARPH